MGDANSEFLRTIETAKEQGLEEEAIGKLYEVQDKVRAGRLQKSLDEQIPVLEELSRKTDVYKKWYPSDPFLQENFMDIESGKNQRFNVMDDIDLQKKYKGEYNLLKSNGLLRRPTVPLYKNGKALTEAQRKRFLNVYWSEYVRYLDNMIGLTEEEFREKKDVVVKSTPSKTKPTPDKYTMLDAYRESAAMVARQQATIALEYPDSNQ